jgi:SWIM/SEC-C metal-binding protein
MSRFFYDGKANNNNERGSGSISSIKVPKIGTKKAPAQISVQSEERKQALAKVFADNKWFFEITINPESDENKDDLETLQAKQNITAAVTTKKANRNDPCPCESGKKYKKCCGA